MKYKTKSNRPTKFATGSQRDSQEGKTRYDLIPPTALKRLADLYARGAELYGDYNWTLGQPFSRLYGSALRHLTQWRLGDQAEDHLSACAWNVFALLHFDEVNRTDLDDLRSWIPPDNDNTNLMQTWPTIIVQNPKKDAKETD